jgi:hypothetical protein
MQQQFKITAPYVHPNSHESSDDPQHIRQMMAKLFEHHPSYERAICRVLLIDYVCLNFELPIACNGMLDSMGQYIPFDDAPF